MIQLAIRVQPGASSSQIVGWISGADGSRVLKIRLRAPALEGQANEALIQFLADTLSIPPRQVSLERGGKSREKMISIQGVTMEQVEAIVEMIVISNCENQRTLFTRKKVILRPRIP